MNECQPNITINVDVTNPGQFFACCGLLELADRLWPGAEGWFNGATFNIATEGTLDHLLGKLALSQISSSLKPEELKRLGTLLSKEKESLTQSDREEKIQLQEMWRLERLRLSEPFVIWLDWWRDGYGSRTNLKTWAAKQLVAEMAGQMFQIVRRNISGGNLNILISTDDPSLPFNFDSDLCRTGNAREAGFSADTLGIKCSYKPLLELLAFIALQRFQPATKKEGFLYCAWTTRFPPAIASVAASGMIANSRDPRFIFSLFNRTKYMKSFLPATPLNQGI